MDFAYFFTMLDILTKVQGYMKITFSSISDLTLRTEEVNIICENTLIEFASPYAFIRSKFSTITHISIFKEPSVSYLIILESLQSSHAERICP